MTKDTLIIGSRSSKLALTQTRLIKDAIEAVFPELKVAIKTIKTTGYKILDVPLSKIGDKGLFTKEIEEALLANEVDLAVHSMKDLPTKLPEGLVIGAVTNRENSCDILVYSEGYTLETLPQGAKVGTSSLRRRAQILNKRSDLEILDLRGNLDTRVRKLEQGQFDAIILAYAGVKRLGLEVKMSIISVSDMLPQAGQGALGIEIRENDPDVSRIVDVLNDAKSRLCVEAERALLAVLEGGCQVPIGMSARIEDEMILISGGVFSLDGKNAVRDEIDGDKKDASGLGEELAKNLLDKGAGEILEEIR